MSRELAVVAGLLARAIVILDEPPSPALESRWGMVIRLDSMGSFHHLQLRDAEILFVGELSDRVCVGQDAFVEGELYDNLFVATDLTIGACFKGNECRPYACLPDDRRPPECRRTSKYE